ncbi:hypothetical protein BH10BAC5_BH10BAC5_02530 [soil metagenome]
MAAKLKGILTSGGELKISKDDLVRFYNDVKEPIVIPANAGGTLRVIPLQKTEVSSCDEQEIEIEIYIHKKRSVIQELITDNNVNIDIGEVEFLSKKLGLDKNSTSSFLNSFGSLNSGKA